MLKSEISVRWEWAGRYRSVLTNGKRPCTFPNSEALFPAVTMNIHSLVFIKPWKKKHGRLYLEHMTNDLNLITMTTNLVISFAYNGRRREMCVGGRKREGTGKRGKVFFCPLLTFLLFASDFLQLTVVFLILQKQLYFKLFIASSRLQMKTKQLLIT